MPRPNPRGERLAQEVLARRHHGGVQERTEIVLIRALIDPVMLLTGLAAGAVAILAPPAGDLEHVGASCVAVPVAGGSAVVLWLRERRNKRDREQRLERAERESSGTHGER